MKKLIFPVLVVIVIFIIYYFNINNNIYYASVGDYLSFGINSSNNVDNNYSNNIKKYYKNKLDKYVNYSSIDDYRVMDLINDINNNKTIIYNNEEYKLQNILIKSNYITLSIGMNDLIYKNNLSYEYMDQLLNDIEDLFTLIRKYNKDRIDYLGFYNIIGNEILIDYANKRLEIICNKNKINYIDISNLNNYILQNIYPSNDGYNYITNQILNFTK